MDQILAFHLAAGLHHGSGLLKQLAQGIGTGLGGGFGFRGDQRGAEELQRLLVVAVEIADGGLKLDDLHLMLLQGGLDLVFQLGGGGGHDIARDLRNGAAAAQAQQQAEDEKDGGNSDLHKKNSFFVFFIVPYSAGFVNGNCNWIVKSDGFPLHIALTFGTM